MEVFLSKYGTLVTVCSSAILLTLGWFIVFNGAKYIASRSEAKSVVNDLISLISSTLNDSIEFWTAFEEHSQSHKSYFLKKSLLTVQQIRGYITILDRYGLNLIDEATLFELKGNLTMLPDSSTESSKPKLDMFCDKKTKDSLSLSQNIIYDVLNEFSAFYTPVTKPVLHKIEFNSATGFIFGAIIMIAFLTMAN